MAGEGKVRGEDLIEDGVFKQLDRLDDTIVGLIKRMNTLETSTRSALGGSEVASNAAETEKAAGRANKALTEQERVLRELARVRERNTKVTQDSLRQLTEERLKRQQLNKALKDEAVASTSLSRAYTALRKQRDLAANSLRDLIASEKASNREIRKAQREFDRLNGKVRKADRAIDNFRDNVGNYGTATRRIVGFTGQLIAAFGVYSALEIGREIFDQVKQLNALDASLKQVTDSQESYNQAQSFLDDLADRAGADIIVLTQRYVNFAAAANQTNLSLEQTQGIYKNIVLAGAVLGKSTDDVNGSLRALEQILSKGKVQAEELRGQLGERLPGAFQILEKALGLANGELNEVLETGGLLSTEAIPALTQGLNEAFSLDTVDRVETLAANQARLTNEFTLFIRQIEEGNGVLSSFFSGAIEFLTASIKGFRILNRSAAENREEFAKLTEAQSFTDTMKSMREEADSTGQSLDGVARSLQSDFRDQLNQAKSQISGLKSQLEELKKLNPRIAGRRRSALNRELEIAIKKEALYEGGLRAVLDVLKKHNDANKELTTTTQQNNDTLEALREKLSNLKKEFDTTDFKTARFKELRGEIKELEALIRRLSGTYRKAKKDQDAYLAVDSIKFAEKLLSGFKKARDEVNVGSEAWFFYKTQVEETEAALQDLKDTAAILSGDLSSIIEPDEEFNPNEIFDFLNNEGLDVILADFSNKFKLNKEELIEEYIDIYGRDFAKFKEFEENKLEALRLIEDEKLALRQKTIELADELSSAFLEIQIARLDEELENQNAIYEKVANNKESSDEAIALAEKDRDAKEKKIEKEKQKRETQAFLFRQALAVADIFLADSLARANAVASTAAIIPYLPLGAATLATLQGLITTNTAFSLGTVLAQTVPKLFYMGKGVGDEYSGDAIWGELQREVKVSKDGHIEVSPDRAAPTTVKSSDIILKSMGDFKHQLGLSGSETSKRIRKGLKHNNSENLSILTNERSGKANQNIGELVSEAVERGLAKAKFFSKFKVTNEDTKITRVP